MNKTTSSAGAHAALAFAAVVALTACAAGTVSSDPIATMLDEPTATEFVAPSATPGDLVEVTGTTRVPIESGSVWDPGGLTGTNEFVTSDERVSGATTYEIHCDRLWEYEDATSTDCRTTITITNAGGAWEGVVIGTSSWTADSPVHIHHMTGTLTGTGGYEGLRFVFRMDGDDYPWSLAGEIEPDR